MRQIGIGSTRDSSTHLDMKKGPQILRPLLPCARKIGPLSRALREDDVEIIVAPASNPIGYSYKAKMLVDAKPSDPLMALLEKVGTSLPQLAAPSTETPKEKAKK